MMHPFYDSLLQIVGFSVGSELFSIGSVQNQKTKIQIRCEYDP